MKVAYFTADIMPNGNFALYHDLLANYPVPHETWSHRTYLVSPIWDRTFVTSLKARCVDVRACFEEFQRTTDHFWEKLRADTEDCDVIISGNISNLDEVLPDSIQKPIVSLSLYESGYRSNSGGYGSFYKPRFHKAAVSKTAVNAFPEHVRDQVEVIYPGIDPARLAQKVGRDEIRGNWFAARSDDVKLALFVGSSNEAKGLDKAIASLDYLGPEWYLIVLGAPKDMRVPEHLDKRVRVCSTTYFVADIMKACDVFVLPTKAEGFNSALLEAWYLNIPVVTTRHKTLLELQGMHEGIDFGTLVDIEVTPQDLAECIKSAKASENASKCIFQNYMASHMIDRWESYLNKIVGESQ